MIWTHALMWLIAGIVLGAIAYHHLVNLGFKHLRIGFLGVCDDPDCDVVHIKVALMPSDTLKPCRSPLLGVDDTRMMESAPFKLGFQCMATLNVRGALHSSMEIAKMFHAHAPDALTDTCDEVLWRLLAEQQDHVLVALASSPPAADDKDPTNGSRHACYAIVAREILDRRKREMLAGSDGAPSEAESAAPNAEQVEAP